MKKVICIVGPTGVGKTELSIKVAKRYNLDVISGDSVQVYRGLDIGSAKITKEEMDGVKHHLIDILDPEESFSVCDFQALVRKEIEKNDLSLIVGGTGLYIKAALCNYEFDNNKRDLNFEEKYKDFSNEELFKLLELRDKKATYNLHMNNRKRVLRALELSYTDKIKSEANNKDEYLYESLIICLNMPRDLLYERINKRVDIMISNGLIDEAKRLYDLGYRLHVIGYKELNEYFDGYISLESAIDLIKKNSRHYAKRQLTWFNNQMDCHMIDTTNKIEAFNNIIKLIEEFI